MVKKNNKFYLCFCLEQMETPKTLYGELQREHKQGLFVHVECDI